MAWSVRARLTVWYTGVVVAVLCAGSVVEIVVQERLATERLDEELSRQIATVEGVMRTEFNEGLDMNAAVAETRSEVFAPGRALGLATTARSPMADWGVAVPSPLISASSENGYRTAQLGSMRVRILQHEVEYNGRRYVAAVGAPFAELEEDHRRLLFAQVAGVGVALIVAAVGGWMILGRLAAAFTTVLNAQRQFMADASHELRTPVSIVRTTAQVALARETRTEDEYRESLSIVAEQTARMTRLVDDMFLLARGEAHGIPVASEPLYFDELVSDAIRGLRVIADARGVRISLEGDTDVMLRGDPVLLRRAIDNLVGNAVRHARDRGLVAIDVRRADGAARLTVRDDGPGVPVGDRERVFERFASLNADAGGAGLGLAIARWIADAHGGQLGLAPSPGPTSEFILTLPIGAL